MAAGQVVIRGPYARQLSWRAGWAWTRNALRGSPKLSLLFLVVAITCAAFAGQIAPTNPITGDLRNTLQAPSFTGWYSHPLGTDHLGRDMLSRLIYGAQISVTVGFFAVFISGAVGTVIALFSGVFRGWVDGILMLITDAFFALPFLMVAVTVISLLGPSKTNVILTIGLLRWMSYARILRSEVLTTVEMDYVRLARVAGAGKLRIMTRHVFPNLLNSLLVIGTLEVGTAVIFEAGLSFLGLGVPRPLPSWGTMLSESQAFLYNVWWLPVLSGIAISLLVMSCNLTGDWLRDRTDPTRRQL